MNLIGFSSLGAEFALHESGDFFSFVQGIRVKYIITEKNRNLGRVYW